MIDKTELVACLDKGFTNEQLSAYFNCGITTVKRAKNNYDLVGYKTNAKPLSIARLQEIEKLADSGNSLADIEKHTGISAYILHKYTPKPLYSKILSNGKEQWVKNLIKADVTPIFTPNSRSAYICGVLQSDGFLTSDGYIGLSARDKDFVTDFAKFFSTGIREYTVQGSPMYGCRFKDVRHLEQFKQVTNIFPQKTYTAYKIPLWISSSEEHLREFIVGVFNGDGCVHRVAGRNTCELSIEQHMANTSMLKEINLLLNWSEYSRECYYRVMTKSKPKVAEFYTWFSNSENAMLRKVTVLDQLYL